MLNTVETTPSETDSLVESGFSQEEIVSLLWLRQWYQNGGSDRVEVIRRLEFLKMMVLNGKIEP
ncbi:MAG TPA: hypothetical protein VFA41_06365 [Ktedonobacteraceae bacterium]|nr:hypothetical protein [Ktedonobacteraceae bacterium]